MEHPYSFFWLDDKQKGLEKRDISPSTLRRIHSAFHKGLNDAVRRRTLKYNPASNVTIAPNAVYIPQYHSGEQLSKLLEASNNDVLEVVLMICARYGTRRSEALGIKESAIYFDSNQIHIRHTIKIVNNQPVGKDITKSKKSNRFLPMSEDIRERLMQIVAHNQELRKEFGPNWNPEGYICVWDDGHLIHPNYATKNYKKIAAKAGIPVNRLHDTRHSVGALQAQNGVPTRTTQGFLGHANIQTTEKYAHLNSKPLESAANTMVELVSLPQYAEI